MDWFQRLTGFAEKEYRETQALLAVEGRELVSRVNGMRYGIGELEVPSLRELRERVRAASPRPGKLRLSVVRGDVRELHRMPAYASSLFQVASQFNLLEMTCYKVTPEHGVTRYRSDPTQGPACAIAAGAATVYRNYFVPVAGQIGQTRDRQLDALADFGQRLAECVGMPVTELWTMRNGYAMCSSHGLAAINAYLRSADRAVVDALRDAVRIGVHWEVDVTDEVGAPRPRVSQAFCSAMPVGYSDIPAREWAALARLVLEAAYEATLLAGALNVARGGTNRVLLTLVGGVSFGNESGWIEAALRRALRACADLDLDVRIVAYSSVPDYVGAIERDFAGR